MADSAAQGRPDRSEYDAYYETYVSRVPDGAVLDTLRAQLESTGALLDGIPAAKHGHRYAEGKWSVREVVGHVLDTERVFTYRALRFARGDATPLPGMDQDEFMAGSNFEARTLADLTDEYRHLRRASIALFASFDDTILARGGVASDCSFTVRSLLYIVAGHERHHVGVLRECYL